ncbi:MAG: transporter substrate-binding domain-containing protein [Pseudomonadota bacterium]
MINGRNTPLWFVLSFAIFFWAGDIHASVDASVPEKKIIVGGNSSYPPYEYLDKEGNPAGFVVELTRVISEEQGINVVIKLGESWTEMRQALETGEIDVLQGISFNEEREKIMDFSPPHSFVSHSIFAHKKARPVHSLEELRRKRVILLGRGIMHDYFAQAGIEIEIIPALTIAEALRLLSTGRHDYAVLATLPATHTLSNLAIRDVKMVAKGIETKKYCYAVKKGNHAVLNRFSEGITRLKQSGRFDELQEKWLPTSEIDPVMARYALVGLVLLASGLVLSLVFSRSLKRQVAIRTAALEREVEKRKQAAEELKRQQQQLVQADKMAALGILVSGMAHEINNPTGLILLNLPTLSRAVADITPILDAHFEATGDFSMGGLPYSQMYREVPAMLDEMLEAAQRIKRIVEDLKHFSGRSDIPFDGEVPVNAVVQTAMRLVQNTLKKATRHAVIHPAEFLPPVKGNSQRLEQVVVNLILNAAQALSDPGKGVFVSTRFEPETKSVIIEVRDEGVGIPPDHLPHLMDPFFTTKRETGGTGLGLAISDGIVREHGGSLTVASETGKGTTVTVRLPGIEEGK